MDSLSYELLSQLHLLSPDEFERFLCALFRELGYAVSPIQVAADRHLEL